MVAETVLHLQSQGPTAFGDKGTVLEVPPDDDTVLQGHDKSFGLYEYRECQDVIPYLEMAYLNICLQVPHLQIPPADRDKDILCCIKSKLSDGASMLQLLPLLAICCMAEGDGGTKGDSKVAFTTCDRVCLLSCESIHARRSSQPLSARPTTLILLTGFPKSHGHGRRLGAEGWNEPIDRA